LATGFCNENIKVEITWLPSEMRRNDVKKQIVTRFARNYSKNCRKKMRKSVLKNQSNRYFK
jgi:hypothetical protein